MILVSHQVKYTSQNPSNRFTTCDARSPCCHFVAPNVRVSATTWRSCETSFSAFLAEVSRALHTYTIYKENLQLLIDDVTAFDFVMQMAHRSFEEETISQKQRKRKWLTICGMSEETKQYDMKRRKRQTSTKS